MHMYVKQHILKKFIDIVYKINDNEIKLNIKKDGIETLLVDPAYTELLKLRIPYTACDEYNIEKTGEMELGIDPEKLRNFVRIFKKDDLVRIDYDSETNRLMLRVGNLTRGMGLIDTAGMPDPEIPEIVFKNKFKILTKTFYENLKKIKTKRYLDLTKISVLKDGIALEEFEQYPDENQDLTNIFIDKNIYDVEIYNVVNNSSMVFNIETVFKQVTEYKKSIEYLIVEINDYNNPLHIIGISDNLEVEYWRAHYIVDDEYAKQEQLIEDKEDVDVEQETELQQEQEIKIPMEPLIAELRYGSTDILFYKNEWFWTGDIEHVNKEDIEHNVMIMKQLYDKYSKQVKGLIGVHKDYDKDYVHLHSNSKTKISDLSKEIRIFSKMTAKNYYESKEKLDRSQWYSFVEQIEEHPESLEAIKEIAKPTEFDKAEPTDATVNGIEYAADSINDPEVYSEIDENHEKYIEKNKDNPEPNLKENDRSDIDIYSDRLSICKPKGLPYNKHQWTIDMEKIKAILDRLLKKASKKALAKATECEGFIFFIVHSTDKVNVDDLMGEAIIKNLLPGGFVLIAWYRYQPEKWIVQAVEKVT